MRSTRKMVVRCGVVCVLVSFGCTVSRETDHFALTVSQVNSDPSDFEGKEILIRGYLVLTPEAHILYESRELNAKFRRQVDANKPDFDPKAYNRYCLTLANPDLLLKNKAALTEKTLTLKGTFLSHYLDGNSFDIGACPLPTAIMIDETDFKRRYHGLLHDNSG
jgi:hypothetical protein